MASLTFKEYEKQNPGLSHTQAVEAWSQYLLKQEQTTTPFNGFAENVEQAVQEYYAMTPEEQQALAVEQGLTPEEQAQQAAFMAGTTPIPPEQEYIEGLPDQPPIEAPPLEPAPAVTAAPTVAAPVVPTMPTVTPTPTIGAPVVPPMPGVTPTPTIGAPTVTPAPAYELTPEQQEMQNLVGTKLVDWVQAGGYGLPPELQAQMIQQQTDTLKAGETENIRVMRNNMERRGITNSGFIFANEQSIKSNTTKAIAGAIADVQINSELMKMASFEKAMGATAQFLGYLSEQSKMIYSGKMATWEAQTQAGLIQYQAQINADMEGWRMTSQYNLAGWQAETQAGLVQYQAQTAAEMEGWRMANQFNLAGWQADTNALFAQWDKNSTAMIEEWKLDNQFSMEEWGTQANYDLAVFQIESTASLANWSAQADIYKMGINQAYQTQNLDQAAQIAEAYAENRFEENKLLAQMEIDNALAMAEAEGQGAISGTIVTGIASIAAAIL